MYKANDKNTRSKCEICSKLTIKTPEWRHWFILMSLLLTLNIFHSLFYCFYCKLWAGKHRLGSLIYLMPTIIRRKLASSAIYFGKTRRGYVYRVFEIFNILLCDVPKSEIIVSVLRFFCFETYSLFQTLWLLDSIRHILTLSQPMFDICRNQVVVFY